MWQSPGVLRLTVPPVGTSTLHPAMVTGWIGAPPLFKRQYQAYASWRPGVGQGAGFALMDTIMWRQRSGFVYTAIPW